MIWSSFFHGLHALKQPQPSYTVLFANTISGYNFKMEGNNERNYTAKNSINNQQSSNQTNTTTMSDADVINKYSHYNLSRAIPLDAIKFLTNSSLVSRPITELKKGHDQRYDKENEEINCVTLEEIIINMNKRKILVTLLDSSESIVNKMNLIVENPHLIVSSCYNIYQKQNITGGGLFDDFLFDEF